MVARSLSLPLIGRPLARGHSNSYRSPFAKPLLRRQLRHRSQPRPLRARPMGSRGRVVGPGARVRGGEAADGALLLAAGAAGLVRLGVLLLSRGALTPDPQNGRGSKMAQPQNGAVALVHGHMD